MGKRSDFPRNPRDFYPTPYEAVVPLVPHLDPFEVYVEPCAGDGDIVRHLQTHGMMCALAFDVRKSTEGFILQKDVFEYEPVPYTHVTNPPWDRKVLHPLITHLLTSGKDVWLLIDADWMHTKQAREYLRYCKKIVSVGRVKWIPGSKMTGKDNCCWYQFNSLNKVEGNPVFVPRT